MAAAAGDVDSADALMQVVDDVDSDQYTPALRLQHLVSTGISFDALYTLTHQQWRRILRLIGELVPSGHGSSIECLKLLCYRLHIQPTGEHQNILQGYVPPAVPSYRVLHNQDAPQQQQPPVLPQHIGPVPVAPAPVIVQPQQQQPLLPAPAAIQPEVLPVAPIQQQPVPDPQADAQLQMVLNSLPAGPAVEPAPVGINASSNVAGANSIPSMQYVDGAVAVRPRRAAYVSGAADIAAARARPMPVSPVAGSSVPAGVSAGIASVSNVLPSGLPARSAMSGPAMSAPLGSPARMVRPSVSFAPVTSAAMLYDTTGSTGNDMSGTDAGALHEYNVDALSYKKYGLDTVRVAGDVLDRAGGSLRDWCLYRATFKHDRNKYECVSIATAIDELIREGTIDVYSSVAVEILLRRFVGVHLADETGSWALCDALEFNNNTHSLLPDYVLSRAMQKGLQLEKLGNGLQPKTRKSTTNNNNASNQAAYSNARVYPSAATNYPPRSGYGRRGGFNSNSGRGRGSFQNRSGGGTGASNSAGTAPAQK